MFAAILLAAFVLNADFELDERGSLNSPTNSYGSVIYDGLSASKDGKSGVKVFIHAFRGTFWVNMSLGFGDRVVNFGGPGRVRVPYVPGERRHLVCSFGGDHTCFIEVDGIRHDFELEESGDVHIDPSVKSTTGVAAKGRTTPFGGKLHDVTFRELPSPKLRVRAVGPLAFVRDSGTAKLRFEVLNLDVSPLEDIVVETRFGSGSPFRAKLGSIAADGSASFSVPFKTDAKPGWRELAISVRGRAAAGEAVAIERKFRAGIGPRKVKGLPFAVTDSYFDVEGPGRFGFNRCGIHGDCLGFVIKGPIGRYDECLPRIRHALDRAVVAGMDFSLCVKDEIVIPKGAKKEDFVRRNAKGEELRPNRPLYEVGNPVLLKAVEEACESWGRVLADYPALSCISVYEETRDAAKASCADDARRYREETGFGMPPDEVFAKNRRTVDGAYVKKFKDGVVPEDDPVLRYFRWFWSGGDGCVQYSAAGAKGFRRAFAAAGRKDVKMMWAPAVRCGPRWNTQGLDLISQWVYPNSSDIIGTAGPVESVLAMARGVQGQVPGFSTQIMAYRNQVCPDGVKLDNPPDWYRDFGRIDYVTVTGDMFTEAAWAALAKPIGEMGFYPWNMINDAPKSANYTRTNPELTVAAKSLLKDTFAPLSPFLALLGREEPDVAVFESFTAYLMTQGWPYGSGWHNAPVTAMERARLGTKVIYEETIERDGLGGVQVVYAPNCAYLTPSMIGRLRAFQSKGGILIGDRGLVRALKADLTIDLPTFTQPPEIDAIEHSTAAGDPQVAKNRSATLASKRKMCETAEKIRAFLKGRYAAQSDSSSSDILVYDRSWNGVPYQFVINDRRTFGEMFGPWGLVMEKGLPNTGWVSRRDPDGKVKAVYELTRHVKMPFVRDGDSVKVDVSFEKNDGRILAYLPAEIADIDVRARIQNGKLMVEMKVLDSAGQAVQALIPVEIRIFCEDGSELDGAGFFAAENGRASVALVLDRDSGRVFRIVCRERAGGHEKTIRVAEERRQAR